MYIVEPDYGGLEGSEVLSERELRLTIVPMDEDQRAEGGWGNITGENR